MKTLCPDLFFDTRNSDDLFSNNSNRQPFFADVLKRWEIGTIKTDNEHNIVMNLMVFNSKCIPYYGRLTVLITFVREKLQEPHLQNPLNPEKGLYLYTLFYLLIRTGKLKESLQVLQDLKQVSNDYLDSEIQISNALFENSDKIYMFWSNSEPKHKEKSNKLANAYFEIISSIMDANELLLISEEFNLNKLPLPVDNVIDNSWGLRSKAFQHFQNKDYHVAIDLYRRMLIERSEVPGTLTHMARIEVIIGNVLQAKTHIEMAWRHRYEAPLYVIARILWFKLCFLKIQNEELEAPKILGKLKSILYDPEVLMEWTMQPVLDELKPKLSENDHSLLMALVESMGHKEKIVLLNNFSEWKEAKPLDIN
jgi:tetratricopeptide (TPR) repeat protein